MHPKQSEIFFPDSEVPRELNLRHTFYPVDGETRHGMQPDFTLVAKWETKNAFQILIRDDGSGYAVIFDGERCALPDIARTYAARGYGRKIADGSIFAADKIWRFLRPFDQAQCVLVVRKLVSADPGFLDLYGKFVVVAPNGDRLSHIASYVNGNQKL